jgi:hypothetical protein
MKKNPDIIALAILALLLGAGADRGVSRMLANHVQKARALRIVTLHEDIHDARSAIRLPIFILK